MADANPPVLYILMRSDMESLNPGKAMAQAAHAANHAVKMASANCPDLLNEWATQTRQGFGVTIVLDVFGEKEILDTFEELSAKSFLSNDQVAYGITHDPTYPVSDGDVTHAIPVNTCAWVLTRPGSTAHKALSGFELYA